MSAPSQFLSVLTKFRKYAFSEQDKGQRFERLIQAYLQTDPQYASKFANVWLWGEFPGRQQFGGGDTGIDIVAKTYEGDYWAVQCKCYAENALIDKKSVDSFLSTSSRTFVNEQGKTTAFAHRLWVSTTNNWGKNAEQAIKNQSPEVSRLGLLQLDQAPVEWSVLEDGLFGEEARTAKKELRKHQSDALNATHEHFKTQDRGRLIMACGTGKTYTSLKIAEHETQGNGLVLFLVPSIALLGQTLREWHGDADNPIKAVCICSDGQASKKKKKQEDSDGYSVVDLAEPASTDIPKIIRQLKGIRESQHGGMTVVFSTYQSIEVVAEAQKALLEEQAGAESPYGIFDLVICDEAHRTTGVTLSGTDESAFVKVHNNDFLKARKRLYMTATPRLYDENAQTKAAMNDAVLCSMDDEGIYGKEVYRIGFGKAVEDGLLTDYKVLVLTVNDNDVPPAVQAALADIDGEISTDDTAKLIGCINALSKKVVGDEEVIKASDPNPMKRAVAFCGKIADSKRIAEAFNTIKETYIDSLPEDKKEGTIEASSDHVDGSMATVLRDEKLYWLKSNSEEKECRILSNVRCLSEGVDVPSLDAVLFLSARNSQVDVVQSVGRVMRRAPGKKYGYIIIPVVVPSNIPPSEALSDNKRYKVVWTVLNALRAHDDRFNALVNKIDLNKKKPSQVLVGRPDNGNSMVAEGAAEYGKASKEINEQMLIQFQQLQSAVYAKMVEKVGDRLYWEQWAKDVAQIAQRQIERINHLIEKDPEQARAFESFLLGLQKNINPSITHEQAVEMLSQHIITKPVFEALFKEHSFVENNPVSIAMQNILSKLEGESVAKESETLQRFYDSVRKRAEGIDNAEGKQRIIIELYDKFFKTAFPKMVEQLGIVYTPVEVVDFIIHSVEDALQQEFGRSISDENVHILDPFTGTGTFMTRLLQSGLIKQADALRKYSKELHANEIVLLAYYIAAINIETTFHEAYAKEGEYRSFQGICLTDTFQLGETKEGEQLFSEMFPQNSERVVAQQKAPIRVVIGNPPYSVGQNSANDNAQNQKYEKLDARVGATYAKATSATNKNSLYDSYIKAIRWASDRLDTKQGGVLAYVSNGSWIDGNATDGLRKCLEKEFDSVYVFNLRGNARTQGELRRKEKDNVFGQGSRTPVSITLLIRNPQKESKKALINYHDIGDYLSRNEKLKIIRDFKSINNIQWKKIKPNDKADWLNQRDELFGEFIPMGDKKDKANKQTFFVPFYSNGVKTNRDAWVYNSQYSNLKNNIKRGIDFFNNQVQGYGQHSIPKPEVKEFISTDPTKFSWDWQQIQDIKKNKQYVFEESSIVTALYRPFFKQLLYFNRSLNNRVYQQPKSYPFSKSKNLSICVSGVGVTKPFSCIITDTLPDLELIGKSQCFPLYYYEEKQTENPTLFDEASEAGYVRRDGITDFIHKEAQKRYGKSVTKEDIFYYVYGLLHSPDYRNRFEADLKKELPRIPLVDEPKKFAQFSKAGRALAELHINYESVPPAEGVVVEGADKGHFKVQRMRFPKKGQKDTIVYNSLIKVTHIPEKAYEYIVNGKPAIEWIMDRYQVKQDKNSGIINDPNDWSEEAGNPRYILDLLLSIINVSVQTVDIVEGLPGLEFG